MSLKVILILIMLSIFACKECHLAHVLESPQHISKSDEALVNEECGSIS